MAPISLIPDVAFGFVLDHEFRRRWAQALIDEYHHATPEMQTPEVSEESLISNAVRYMASVIPEDVHNAVPRLPCLQRYLLPVKERGVDEPRNYVFVLQEDPKSCSPPVPENVELARKALGLGDDQEPVWVRIDRCVETALRISSSYQGLIRAVCRGREMC